MMVLLQVICLKNVDSDSNPESMLHGVIIDCNLCPECLVKQVKINKKIQCKDVNIF